jgi:1-deoxy-D-xylulose-5-phosphate synthase
MAKLLPELASAEPLQRYSVRDLEQLAGEIREVLCNLLSTRSAHFASNLGVVELCLALHSVYDFRRDRLIWDTGHQIYPHKLVTGRYRDFDTIRTKGGLMGYPNPHESEYDLFMTGHAGCSVSTAMGLRSGDLLRGEDERHAVAVIGDGAFPSGIVFEALNNAKSFRKNLLIVLNDN